MVSFKEKLIPVIQESVFVYDELHRLYLQYEVVLVVDVDASVVVPQEVVVFYPALGPERKEE